MTLLTAASLSAATGCGGATSGSSATGAASSGQSPSSTASSGSWKTYCDEQNRPQNPCGITDATGREWLLRGVNARVEGVFDVSFADGRQPLEPIPSLDATDVAQMRQIGFNLLRLPVQWSAIEPAPGQYDQAYLDRIKSVVELCAQGGIQVLVDFHQDAYSKEIGEDGAPLWAITPAPIDPNKGGSLNLLPLRLSTQTNEAFASFWRNEQVAGKGLQDHYIAAITHVAEAVNGTPAVIGVDLFNEPWLLHAQSLLTAQGKNPQLNLDMLYAFYAKAIPAVRAALPNKLIMFEPDVAKNDPASIPPGSTSQPPYTATVPAQVPWPSEGTVYAPHFYIKSFFSPGDAAAGYPNVRPDDPDITANLNNSMAEAKAFGSPLLLGEFGFTPKAAQYQATINAIYAQTNKNAISTAQWLWKEESQDSWGFFDYSTGTPVLRSEAAAATAQPYPQAVSGKLTSAAFDQGSQTLTVNFVYADTKGPNLIFVPTEYGFKGGYEVKCGQDVVQTSQSSPDGWLSVECGKDVGKAYTLTVQPMS